MTAMRRKLLRWLGNIFFGAAIGLNIAGLQGCGQVLKRSHPAPTSQPTHVSKVSSVFPRARLGLPLTVPVVFKKTNPELPVIPAVDNPPAPVDDKTTVPVVVENSGPELSPPEYDPVCKVPNFFGGFYARGSMACVTMPSTIQQRILTYTGPGEGFFEGNSAELFGVGFSNDIDVFGPGGPYVIQAPITGTGAFPNYTANEHPELTSLVRMDFPGAAFLNGSFTFDAESEDQADFLFNYLFTSGRPGQTVCVDLPNPSGGGLVGRNKYFDNGSPLPRDRVYFFDNYVGSFRGLSTPFSLNRYVFGAEKTFFDDLASVEVRVPFAGTADSDQVGGQSLQVNHGEFGNVGVVLKGVAYRTPNFVASVGLGISIPTADDSRMLLGNQSVIEIQNHTWLLQPLLGMAWAPNDRFYAQTGLQFDLAPNGNPVRTAAANGDLTRAGVLTDQRYVYVSGAAGYWLYQNAGRTKGLTGVALQGELHYNSSFGTLDIVQSGNVLVADLGSQVDIFNATAGLHFLLGNRAMMSVGASAPLTGDRLYDWSVICQLNYYFGPGPAANFITP